MKKKKKTALPKIKGATEYLHLHIEYGELNEEK